MSSEHGAQETFKKLDEVEAELEIQCPNPRKVRLIEIHKEYNPTEIQDMLQAFGSHIAYLTAFVATLEAQTHALKETYKAGIQVAVSKIDPKLSLTAREGEVLATQDIFNSTKKLQIVNESALIMAKGWLEAYEAAYTTVSRMVTLLVGEQTLQTGRHA